MKITLASNSSIRKQLLSSAGVVFDVEISSFDEDNHKRTLLIEGHSPFQIAEALAIGKAREVARHKDGIVIGCDQVLALNGTLISKPKNKNEARQQLKQLRGNAHRLLSAAAIYEDGELAWTKVGIVTLTMRDFSDKYLEMYLDHNWHSVQTSVGGYKLEEEGVRLFSDIKGDYFTVLGMPLIDILEYLGRRGVIET